MFIPFLALAMAFQTRAADETPNFLLRACKVALAVKDRTIRNPEETDWLSTGECTGYFHGFLDDSVWSASGTKGRLICAPEGTNFFEVARKYVEYANKHASVKNEDNPSFGVLLFLKEIYPCPAK